jgi:hypothetical protein
LNIIFFVLKKKKNCWKTKKEEGKMHAATFGCISRFYPISVIWASVGANKGTEVRNNFLLKAHQQTLANFSLF